MNNSPKERKVNRFSPVDCWKISPAKDAVSFFRALVIILPPESVLYLESGGEPPDDIKAFLLAKHVEDRVIIPGGTLLPKPQIYRIAVTNENIETLAQLLQKYPTPVGSVHVHVYRSESVLLWGYDAFLDPFFISKDVPENNVKSFCEELGLRYEDA